MSIYSNNESLALRLWALTYFTAVECPMKSLLKPVKQAVLKFDETAPKLNIDQLNHIQFCFNVLTKQKMFEDKIFDKMLQIIHHENGSVARLSFVYLCEHPKFSETALTQVLKQFKKKTISAQFRYLLRRKYKLQILATKTCEEIHSPIRKSSHQ